MEERRRRRFLWGILLAWAPAVPLIFGFMNAVRGISHEKATGLAAVAGGLAEVFLTFGLIVTLVFEVGAIFLLLRVFSREHLGQTLFSIASICLSGFMIFLLAVFLWLYFVQLHSPR